MDLSLASFIIFLAGAAAGTAIGGAYVVMQNKPISDQFPKLKEFLDADATDNVTMNFTVTVRKRWAVQLIGMLNTMQSLGSMGSSRMIGFYADGDGDFRPKFSIEGEPIWDKETQSKGNWALAGANTITSLPESRPTVDVWFDAG